MPGARAHPQPRAQLKKHTSLSHHRYTAINRHSLRDGFTVSFVLSPVIGLFCHRHPAEFPQGLTPASRHQDHTTSPSAQVSPVQQFLLVHRISRPTFVTIAKRPS
jgi:hypothetical protein